MKRLAVSTLLVPICVFFLARPAGAPAVQSPVATPPATRVQATGVTSPLATLPSTDNRADRLPAEPAIPPIVWIVAGLILGGVIVLIAQQTSPHDG